MAILEWIHELRETDGREDLERKKGTVRMPWTGIREGDSRTRINASHGNR
jgi:hypothetical protein